MRRDADDGHQRIRLGLYISAECEQRVVLLLLLLLVLVMLLVLLVAAHVDRRHADRRFRGIVFGVTGLRDYAAV